MYTYVNMLIYLNTFSLSLSTCQALHNRNVHSSVRTVENLKRLLKVREPRGQLRGFREDGRQKGSDTLMPLTPLRSLQIGWGEASLRACWGAGAGGDWGRESGPYFGWARGWSERSQLFRFTPARLCCRRLWAVGVVPAGAAAGGARVGVRAGVRGRAGRAVGTGQVSEPWGIVREGRVARRLAGAW